MISDRDRRTFEVLTGGLRSDRRLNRLARRLGRPRRASPLSRFVAWGERRMADRMRDMGRW